MRNDLLERHPGWVDSPLLTLAMEIEACRACNLGSLRNRSVPGMGNPKAKLVFAGEAPGPQRTGRAIPFICLAGGSKTRSWRIPS